MSDLVVIESDGPEAARTAMERSIAAGEVVVFPADGLYGLACDPLNARAIERIRRIKGRDDGKPSAVMYFSPLAMREMVEDLGARVREAVAALLPGPVTLVVPNRSRRYPLAGGDDSERLGLRLIEGPLAGAMCPVFQTSANLSGEPAPSRYGDLPAVVRAGAELAIDGGELAGTPSTVIDLGDYERSGEWRVLREGAMGPRELARVLGPL